MVSMRHYARHGILEEIQAATRPLGRDEASHDDAAQLRRVGHRAGLRVAVHSDGVIDSPVM